MHWHVSSKEIDGSSKVSPCNSTCSLYEAFKILDRHYENLVIKYDWEIEMLVCSWKYQDLSPCMVCSSGTVEVSRLFMKTTDFC